jgi:hypothetical protein
VKKWIVATLGILLAILLVAASLTFLYLNRIEEIEVRSGKYFDVSGNQLGSCKIESKLMYLADMPTSKTYYYDLNENYIGYCDGFSIGCSISEKEEPKICEPMSFQKSCDKAVSGFGAMAKFRCILE